MMEKYIHQLNQVRKNEINITDFYYKPAINAEGREYDENELKRYQVLVALLYDDPTSDEELIRDLFRQEIIVHEKSVSQGLGESLNLNAYLLSGFRNPANVWLFVEAKNANFDTACGFDYQYLVSAGINETYEFVDASDVEAKEKFYHIVGDSVDTCHIDMGNLHFNLVEKSKMTSVLMRGTNRLMPLLRSKWSMIRRRWFSGH